MDLGNSIVALARYKEYLFIATSWGGLWNNDAKIHRCKFDWKNMTVDKSSCEVYNEVLLHAEEILCMVIVGNYLFAGRSDDVMWRCSTEK